MFDCVLAFNLCIPINIPDKRKLSWAEKKKAVNVKRAGLATPIQSWPHIRPLNFTIGGPQLLPCAKWSNLHSPSAAAAPSELEGGRRGSARLPSEARACQSVSLHPVGQLYVNVVREAGDTQQSLGLPGRHRTRKAFSAWSRRHQLGRLHIPETNEAPSKRAGNNQQQANV